MASSRGTRWLYLPRIGRQGVPGGRIEFLGLQPNMIRRPRARVKLTKKEIFRRDNYTCQYCGRQSRNLTVDHVIPRHHGGQHNWENLVSACPACNRRKGGRTLQQVHMQLLQRPCEPRATSSYLFGRYLKENQEWEQFIKGW